MMVAARRDDLRMCNWYAKHSSNVWAKQGRVVPFNTIGDNPRALAISTHYPQNSRLRNDEDATEHLSICI